MAQIEMNPEFSKALQLMRKGRKRLFITGRAGTGKSTLLRLYAEEAREKPVVLAPTGVAALNAGGQTIHRFFRFKIDITPAAASDKKIYPEERGLYSALRTVIIDEASMLRADILDCMDIVLKRAGPLKGAPFGGVRMIFFGDLHQIPPVVTNEERKIFNGLYSSPYFFHAKALEGLEWDIVELEKIYRQSDKGFIEILNRIRQGAPSKEDLLTLNSRAKPDFKVPKKGFWITLTGTNRRADEVNARQLASLPGRSETSHAKITGDFSREHCPAPQKLSFKKKAQVMMLNNDPDGQWVNGSVGAVQDIISMEEGDEAAAILLQGEKKPVIVSRYKWELVRFGLEGGAITSQTVGKFSQLPFRLAWAVTIHKSQGKTYHQVVFDCDRVFGFGQAYVALSRCSSLEGLILRRPLSLRDIRTDWRIQKFLSGKRIQQAEKTLSFEDKMALIEKAIKSSSPLKMTYLRGSDLQTERVVTPVSAGEEEYKGHAFHGMRGICALRGSERVFRIDRILSLEPHNPQSKSASPPSP